MKQFMMVLSIIAGLFAVVVSIANFVAWSRIDAERKRKMTEPMREASLRARRKPVDPVEEQQPNAGNAEIKIESPSEG